MVQQFGCLGSDSVKVTDSRDGPSCHCFVCLDKKLHYVLIVSSQPGVRMHTVYILRGI